jgi:hypothetical protein
MRRTLTLAALGLGVALALSSAAVRDPRLEQSSRGVPATGREDPCAGGRSMIAHADAPPAIVQGRPARAIVGYYFGVRTHKDGSFAGWFKIPCNGRCHTFKMTVSPIVGILKG